MRWHRFPMSQAALAVGLAVVLSLLNRPAAANGKFPSADQLVVDPSDPNHLVVRTTFGILTSKNQGADWELICESAANYKDYEPGIAVTGEGALITALYEGVGVSTPNGCGWSLANGVVRTNVADVSVWPSQPSTAVALTTVAAKSRYLVSTDAGKSFAQAGVDLPEGFAGLTLDVMSAVDPPRIYVSGLDTTGSAPVGKLARSDDGGATWQVFDIPGSDGDFAPYIGAMHPTDPKQLWVRLAGGPGRLLMTSDGGATWKVAWTSPLGPLRGFALSPDGETVLVGTEFDGLWRATVKELKFEKISSLAIRCVTWKDERVFVCVNEYLYGDGFIVGMSTEGGENIEPLLQLACVRGALECPEGTPVAAQCPVAWEGLQTKLMTDDCGPAGSEPSDGAGGSGGAASAGGAGGDLASPNQESCSCRVPGEPARRTSFPSLCLVVALVFSSRRRSRRPPLRA